MVQLGSSIIVRLFVPLVAVAVAACGTNVPTPPPSPPIASPIGSAIVSPSQPAATAPPTVSTTSTPSGGSCGSSSGPGYHLAGWEGDRIVVVANESDLCTVHDTVWSVDPAVGSWRSEATFYASIETYDSFFYVSSTDGRSIAYPAMNQIVVIDRAGQQHVLPRPAWARQDWDAYGLPALPGGGYLVIGTDRLLRISPDGTRMTTDPLPAGYVPVGSTSDPDQFILTRAADASGPYGLGGKPFRAYLWNRATGALHLVAKKVDTVSPSNTALALLSLGTKPRDYRARTWWALAGDRSMHLVERPSEDWTWLSPDGMLLLTVPPVGGNGPLTAGDVALIAAAVRSGRTGRIVARVTGAPIVDAAWKGDELAAITETPFPQPVPQFICVVANGRIIRLALP